MPRTFEAPGGFFCGAPDGRGIGEPRPSRDGAGDMNPEHGDNPGIRSGRVSSGAAFQRPLVEVRVVSPKRPGRAPLERALSKLGVASRTQARALVLSGRVSVDGRVVRDPLAAVVPESAALRLDGERVRAPLPLTVALHKPRGVVTTRSDERGRRTVYAFLTEVPSPVVPVGRLDLATSGLLLLTNDTRFADWLTDPANAIPRVYLVSVRGDVSDEAAAKLRAGVEEGGERLSARAVQVRKRSRRESHLVVELVEGKNREVRRMLRAIGHEVTRLRRVSFGGIQLGDLAPGTWREVPREELRRAFPEGALLLRPQRGGPG